jgi:DNA-binding transcriptional regulator GbsR (MarR family)
MNEDAQVTEVRRRLVETGGRTSQELGVGRIVGQVMLHLYLHKEVQSLDRIEEALCLSKASISIAVRQLEQFGLVQRVWIKGDRKKYYKSSESIATSIQQGLLSFLRQKVILFGAELDLALETLEQASHTGQNTETRAFLLQRLYRAKKLHSIVLRLLGNPVVNFLAKYIK